MDSKNPYSLKLFSVGTEITQNFSKQVSSALGTPLEEKVSKLFSSGEFLYHQANSVRDCDVYIIFQPRYGDKHKLAYDMSECEQLIFSINLGEPNKITVIVPCLPYTRQDKPSNHREPTLVQMFPAKIQKLGAKRIVTFCLHNPSSNNGHPDAIFINDISTDSLFIDFLKKKNLDLKNLKIVSPDLGASKAARRIAGGLGIPRNLIILDKVRDSELANSAEVINVIGDPDGFDCIITDDMADTSGTALKSARALREKGAKRIYFMAVHGILSGPALKNLQDANFDGVWLGDTCDVSVAKNLSNFEVINTWDYLSIIIENLHNGKSINDLYKNKP